MRTTLSVSLFVALIAGSVTAQAKPDFAGRWVLANAGDAGVDVAEELTVSTLDTSPVPLPSLKIERHLKGGVRSETYQIGLVGGVVGGISLNAKGEHVAPSQTRHSTTWNGNKLVIATASYSGLTRESGPYTEREEVWSLDDEGRLVIVVTERSSTAARPTLTLMYRRP
jgi:hypothetical protein